jgi:hypothetical protein
MRDQVSKEIDKVGNAGNFIKIRKGKKRRESKSIITKERYNKTVERVLNLSVATQTILTKCGD